MHSEVHLNEAEIIYTFDGLTDELDVFFLKNIGTEYKTISGYGSLLSNFLRIKELLAKNILGLKSEAIETLLNIFEKCGVSIGINEIKRITNINTSTKIFDILFSSNLCFGTGLYNGYCSGDLKYIKRIGEKKFTMYTSDNGAFYDFTFRSLILFIPDIESPSSPILFIESDDEIVDKSLEQFMKEYDGVKHVNSLFNKKENGFIYNPVEISEILESSDYDSVEFEDHYQFFSKGLLCFINVQRLDYNREYKSFIYNNKFIDGKEFEVLFRKSIKEK